MPNARIVIIGAGMGGLASALMLARQGLEVTVVEAAASPGGKMRQLMAGGLPVDSGPTVLTMCWVFEELAREAGFDLRDLISLQSSSILARHGWSDGAKLDLYADLDQSVEAIHTFSGLQDAKAYRHFAQRAGAIYATLKDSYIRAPRPNLLQLIERIGFWRVKALSGLSPYQTLARTLEGVFRDPRLRQLFARYATYSGSSPYAAPATLMLIAHVEREGVWLIQGGMQKLAEALADMAQSLGVQFHYQRQVTRICMKTGRASGVELETGEILPAAAVIMNGEASALAEGLLGNEVKAAVPAVSQKARSLSAITWSMQAKATGFPLTHHNVFFCDDYRQEFDDILLKGHVPKQPTVYICAQDREGSAAPSSLASERLFCLINAPANGDHKPYQPADIHSCTEAMYHQLQRCGLEITPVPGTCEVTTPAHFARLFPASGGALYGRAQHGWRASFARPGARTKIPGLYLAGGSAHPGPGLPMAALSGRQAARSVMMDLASIMTFHPLAMSGGMSMPSAPIGSMD
ncbi:MAG: phytoene desaturase [Alphaproteobacteria bacterium]|nr:phytoene desaturase [Alphaproteobacteria bacterium]